MMMKKILLFTLSLLLSFIVRAQNEFPVRGLSIAAPDKAHVDQFVKFINDEIAPRGLNTLILRVDYNFKYKTHPELAEENGLSQADVDKMVAACQKHGIAIIPQVNLLGHQSWHSDISKLLEVDPEFDETPGIKLSATYVWPNADGLYCKSYCPLHPEVHKVVFEVMDEIVAAFKADAFHAGMDEVFYIGHEDYPRCQGRDKAELFAGELTKIRNHLALKNKRLWIWGDRLIDGKTTGIGLWEGSYNNTHRAIDLIPKDVMICDWHYERPDPTAVYFAMKGFDVATSPWKKTPLALQQKQMMLDLRANSTPEMKSRFTGMVQTVWSDAGSFLDRFNSAGEEDSDAKCFRALFEKE